MLRPVCPVEQLIRKELNMGSFYTNKKNGKLYCVLHECPDVTENGERDIVVYSDSTGHIWARSRSEFYAKFSPYTPDPLVGINTSTIGR